MQNAIYIAVKRVSIQATFKQCEKNPNMALVLLKGIGVWNVFAALFYYHLYALFSFVPVLVLNDLVKYFEAEEGGTEHSGFANPWVDVAIFFLAPSAAFGPTLENSQGMHKEYVSLHDISFPDQEGCMYSTFGSSLRYQI